MSVAEVVAGVALAAVAGAGVAYVVASQLVAQAASHRAAAERAALAARRDLAAMRSGWAVAEARAQDRIATEGFPAAEIVPTLGELLEAEGLEDVTTPEDSLRRIVRLAPREDSTDGTTRPGGVRHDG